MQHFALPDGSVLVEMPAGNEDGREWRCRAQRLQVVMPNIECAAATRMGILLSDSVVNRAIELAIARARPLRVPAMAAGRG